MKYLVRLKPLTPFFFGGNQTFSSFNGQSQLHYISKSTRLPQQTHILGMIRKVLLEKEGLLTLRDKGLGISPGDDEKAAFDLVGGGKDGEVEVLGKIKTLSPVFLEAMQGSEVHGFHLTLPKDAGLKLNDKLYAGSYVCVSGMENRAPLIFENFEAKKGLKEGLTKAGFWEAYTKGCPISETHILSLNDIFQEVWQIGIKRTNRTVNEDDDGSLYKKCSYSFKAPFQFAFILELEDSLFGASFSRQVNMGAERSLFQLEINELKEEQKSFYPSSTTQNITKAVVLGELFLEADLFSSSAFVLNEGYKPFARLVPWKETKGNNYRTRRTEQKNLLPRGSVIFFPKQEEEKEKLRNILEKGDPFYTAIGYNQLLYI